MRICARARASHSLIALGCHLRPGVAVPSGPRARRMFGGVVFGQATFGMRGRPDVFLSYAWGERVQMGGAAGDGTTGSVFATQAIVSSLKADLESGARLKCWFDLERLGGGTNLQTAMEEGVKSADVFVCCLTDRYLTSTNCQQEFAFAVKHKKLIVPLLLEGYGGGQSAPPWPPQRPEQMRHALRSHIMYVDMRSQALREREMPRVVETVDAEVRRCKDERYRSRRDGEEAAVAQMGSSYTC